MARGGDIRCAAAGAFVRDQSFEHTDGRVERRSNGAAFGLAVPPAILELFSQQPRDDWIDLLAEVHAQRDRTAVDARLHLAGEERLSSMLPPAPVANARDCMADASVVRIDAECVQQFQGRQRRCPRLPLAHRSPVEVPREAGAARPLAVFPLQRQQSGPPTLAGHPRALRFDDLGGRMDEITQHLPADGRVRVEQPVQYRTHDPYYGAGIAVRSIATGVPPTMTREQIWPWPIAYFTVGYIRAVVIANASVTTARGPHRLTISRR